MPRSRAPDDGQALIAATAAWNRSVVKQFGSANSSIASDPSQLASALARSNGLLIASACGASSAIRSAHSSAAPSS